MDETRPRIRRETKTVGVMIRMYCKKKHKPEGDLCEECRELKAYAQERLLKCLFQENKTPCGKCTSQCYGPEQKEKIREVMRYAGPRMMLRHPWLAIRHILDGKK
jgi:hypothetical protein